jgi:phage FluMu protein Com
MDFSYRIKLYVFGFLLGLLILGIILKGKKCSSVNEMKLIEITDQQIYLSNKAQCQLNFLSIHKDSLRMYLQSNFRINYDKSEVRAIPCGKLFIEGTKNNMPFNVVMLDCDTISRIEEFQLATPCPQCDTIR